MSDGSQVGRLDDGLSASSDGLYSLGGRPTSKRRRSRKTARLLGAGAAFLVFTALIIVIIWVIRRPREGNLTLVGARAPANLTVPANPSGWNALEALKQEVTDRGGIAGYLSFVAPKMHLRQDPRWLDSPNDWDDLLLDKFGDEKTAVFYLDLPGFADGDGAYLLTGNGGKLRVAKVLETLGTCEWLKGKNVVLLLDATKVQADWTRTLHNDFAHALSALDPEIKKNPKLVVISASDENQRSWVSEEWRKSIFGQKVLEGLQGWAVGDNKRVTALDLYNYVLDGRGKQCGVTGWVAATHDARQTPVLFPSGDEGKARAKGMGLTTVDTAPAGAPKPDPADRTALLAGTWAEHDALRTRNPRPESVCPHLWAEYRQTLLRCEELAWLGRDDEATALRDKKLSDLKKKIENAYDLGLTSSGNSLAMPRAFANPPPKPDGELEQQFQAVWDGKKRWDEVEKAAPGRGDLRAVFGDWLLGQVVKDRSAAAARTRVSTANEAFRTVSIDTNDWPAEALFLAMLERHLRKDKAPPEELPGAITLRRRAERAALAVGVPDDEPDREPESASSERVYRWIAVDVEKADQYRRLGEDCLFVEDAAYAPKAKDYFAKAAAGYGEAEKKAAVARRALAARDEAFSDLPHYSRWLSRSGEAGEQELVALWAEAHRIDELLQSDNPDLKTGSELDRAGRSVSDGLKAARENFVSHCAKLEKDSASLPDRWLKVEEALAVPLAAAGQRARLRARLQKIARELNEKSINGELVGKPPDQGKADQQAREAERRERAMAQAVLGSRVNAQTGEAIAAAWQQKADALKRPDQEATPPGGGPKYETLARAERECRQIDGALVPDLKTDPADALRRLRARDLLRWLAQRTLRDQWWGEPPDDDHPYYKVAGRKYLDDAGKQLGPDLKALAEQRPADAPGLDRELSPTAKPGFYVVWGGGSQYQAHKDGKRVSLKITGDPEIKLPYKLEVGLPGAAPANEDAALPVGLPVAWVEADPSKLPDSFQKDIDQRHVRRPRELNAPGQGSAAEVGLPALELQNPYPLHVLINPEKEPFAGKKDSAELAMHALYRGRTAEAPTALAIEPAADSVIYQHPVAYASGVAVIPGHPLPAPPQGMMVIVLDFSESMTKKTATGRTRQEEAVKALDAVLAKLPEGTVVGVLVFGQKENVGEGFGPAKMIQVLHPPRPWKDGQRDGLVADAKRLTPAYGTPLAHAIYVAKKQLFEKARVKYPAEAKAGQTLLVLTDGDDNTFDKDKKDGLLKTEAKDIPEFMKEEFDDEDIAINLVLFEASPVEHESALKQFEGIERLKRRQGEIYGKEKPVSAEALADKLKYALGLYPSYRISDHGRRVVPWDIERARAPEELNVARQPAWYFVKPGGYDIASKFDLKNRQRVWLEPGESLLLKLAPGGFDRASLDDIDRKGRARERSGPWRLTVLANEVQVLQESQGSHYLLAALENLTATDKGENVATSRPKEVWFELKGAADARPPAGFRWGGLPAVFAPSWELRLPHQPDAARLTVWFSDGPAESVGVWKDDGSVPDLAQPLPLTVPLANGERAEVQLSTARLTVVNSQGKDEKQVCLIVRAAYKADSPLFARLPNLDPTVAGYEHHYYARGGDGRYTGIFWFGGLSEKDVARRAAKLRLVAVESLKKEGPGNRMIVLTDEQLGKATLTNNGPEELNLTDILRKYAEKHPAEKDDNR